MAEAWLNELGGDLFEAESAGLTPGVLNPFVVRVMQEEGIDISHKEPRNVFDVFRSGVLFAYVIAVCDETSAERCPIFPGVAKRIHWTFPDPSQATGTEGEKLEQVRMIRDEIRSRIIEWLQEQRQGLLTSGSTN
jgi:arsenate reductase